MAKLLLLLLTSSFSTVLSFNIDATHTVQEYSVESTNLQFGYTVSFLNQEKLIVGAPPPNRTETGSVFSCDIKSKKCEKFENEVKKDFVPLSTGRCFTSRYNEDCGETGADEKWYYDPVFTNCKSFTPTCSKNTQGRNIFAHELNCTQTCRAEILQRATSAKKLQHARDCKIVFQNAHNGRVKLMQKNEAGGEEPFVKISNYFAKDIKTVTAVCGLTFVAKSSKSSEYLYFIDEDNRFDIIYTPQKDGMVVTIATMEEYRTFLNSESVVKKGLSLLTMKNKTIACEPQYGKTYLGSFGRCSVFNSDQSLRYNVVPLAQKVSNSESDERQYYGYSVAGLGTAGMVQNPSLFFAGAPNAMSVGVVVAISTSDGENLGIGTNPLDDTDPGAAKDSLWGYALSAGNLHERDGNDRKLKNGDVVGGGPRGGANMRGHVLIIRFSNVASDKFQLLQKIDNPDPQVGSYFGSAVCVADINNDGKDDVLIGSPYFAKVYDEGRVNVYINKEGKEGSHVEHEVILEGRGIAGERFGTTIANIGDVNKDGFIDIAVGAPGGEKGSVYIFNSHASGINDKYSQVISESGFAPGFGISITGGADINGDSFGDIAVGSYLGGKAYVIRSRPVIVLKAKQRVNITNVPPDVEDVNCHDEHGHGFHCVKLDVTLQYEGKGTPDTFDIEITYNMDATKIFKRAKLMDDTTHKHLNEKTRKITLRKGIQSTVSEDVFVRVINHQRSKMDLFSTIVLETSYDAPEIAGGCGRVQPCAILAKTEQTKSVLAYAVKCLRNVCNPNLVLTSNVQFSNDQRSRDIIYGVTQNVIVNTTIKNTRETAYQPKLSLKFPSDFDVVDVKVDGYLLQWDDKELPIHIPYTINTNTQRHVLVKLAIIKSKPSTTTYTFKTQATAIGIGIENPTNIQRDNFATVNVSAQIETCMEADARSDQSHVLYRSNEKRKWNASMIPAQADLPFYGYEVMYTFLVNNLGKNTLDSLMADVMIVDGVKDVKFMCIKSMVVDQVPCREAANCQQYLKDRMNEKDTERSETVTNARSIRCKINSIEVRKWATIRIKTLYFPDALSKLSQFSDMSFHGGLSNVGEQKSNFTSMVKIYHNDDMLPLYYQRTGCTTDNQVTVTFIERGEEVFASSAVPIWIIAASVAAAMLLLLCLVIILFRVGFFDRKTLEDDEEDEEEEEEDENEEGV